MMVVHHYARHSDKDPMNAHGIIQQTDTYKSYDEFHSGLIPFSHPVFLRDPPSIEIAA
jgi:hypothetical protein